MIRLVDVTKRFAPDAPPAVDALDLTIAEGEIMMLVGPSGCGKTTTLRMINRLIEPTSGRIELAGEDVTHVDPVQLRRRIGYVIQQVGLFPHQSVADNIATVPKLLGWDRRRIAARVDELLSTVQLDASFAHRYPHELSGGQRQRVGVARALAADPPVLLMDEPFGAIDPITRTQLQDEFVRMQEALHKTIVFVTHDLDEAVRLGDRVALLAVGGHLVQVDSPDRLLGAPDGEFATAFVGDDRGLRRLEVTRIDSGHLIPAPSITSSDTAAAVRTAVDGMSPPIAVVVDADGRPVGHRRIAAESDSVSDQLPTPPAMIAGEASLKDAMSRLLLADDGWLPVTDPQGRYLGVLTADAIHRATRASLPDRSN